MIIYMQQLIHSRFLAKAVHSYLCVSKEVRREIFYYPKKKSERHDQRACNLYSVERALTQRSKRAHFSLNA